MVSSRSLPVGGKRVHRVALPADYLAADRLVAAALATAKVQVSDQESQAAVAAR